MSILGGVHTQTYIRVRQRKMNESETERERVIGTKSEEASEQHCAIRVQCFMNFTSGIKAAYMPGDVLHGCAEDVYTGAYTYYIS